MAFRQEKDGFKWQPVLKHGLIGANTLDGKVLVPAKFKDCIYKNKFFYVRTNSGLAGVFSSKGRVVVPPSKYMNVLSTWDEEDAPFVVIGLSGWGLVSIKGKILIPEEYDAITPVDGADGEHYFLINKIGYVGIANSKGKIEIPVGRYTSIMKDGSKKTGYTYPFVISELGQSHISGVCNAEGKEIIQTNYHRTRFVHDSTEPYFEIEQGGCKGKLTLDGKKVSEILPKKTIRTIFQYGSKLPNNKWILVQDEYNKCGAVSSKGDTIVPCKYDMVTYEKDGGFFRVVEGRYQGAYSIDGSKILDPQELNIAVFGDENKQDYIYFQTERREAGVVYGNGQVLKTNFKYIEVLKLSNYKGDSPCPIWCKTNGKVGVIDFSGKEIIPCVFDNVAPYVMEKDFFFCVFKNGRCGLFTKGGKQLTPIDYDKVSITSPLGSKLYILTKNGDKMGLLNINGECIINSETFTNIEYLHNNTFKATVGKRCCVYDVKGKLLSDNQPEVERDEFIAKADDAFEKGDYKKASFYYGQALTIRSDASMYFNRGVSYYNGSKYNEAIDDFKSCLNSSPSSNLQTRCVDLISKANFYQEQQEFKREQMTSAIFGLLINTANAYYQYKTNKFRPKDKLSQQTFSNQNGKSYSDSEMSSEESAFSSRSSRKICHVCKGDGKCIGCRGSGLRTDKLFGTGVDPTHKCSVCGGDGVCNICNGNND